MCQLLGVKISRVSEISDEFVQWLHDFFGAIHWVVCKEAADGGRGADGRRCGMRIRNEREGPGHQLWAEP